MDNGQLMPLLGGFHSADHWIEREAVCNLISELQSRHCAIAGVFRGSAELRKANGLALIAHCA